MFLNNIFSKFVHYIMNNTISGSYLWILSPFCCRQTLVNLDNSSMICDFKCSSIVTYFFVRWSPDYTWHQQSFCRQQRFKRPLPIAGGKANRQRKMENLALYITTIGHNLCTFDAIFLHDKKDNFFKQCSFLKIHFYRLILTFNFMASNQMGKNYNGNLEKNV